MLFGKTRLDLLLFGNFLLMSIFCFRTCALRQLQEDECLMSTGEKFPLPLTSVVPSQRIAFWALPAVALKGHPPCSAHRNRHSTFTPALLRQTHTYHTLHTRHAAGTRHIAFLRLAVVPNLTELTSWLSRPTLGRCPQYPETCYGARREGQQAAGSEAPLNVCVHALEAPLVLKQRAALCCYRTPQLRISLPSSCPLP